MRFKKYCANFTFEFGEIRISTSQKNSSDFRKIKMNEFVKNIYTNYKKYNSDYSESDLLLFQIQKQINHSIFLTYNMIFKIKVIMSNHKNGANRKILHSPTNLPY